MTDAPDAPDAPGTRDDEAASARIREELEKTASLISGARRLMGEGRNVDLSALEERTRAVSAAVQSAPKAIAQGYAEHLDALMAALDALESDLETQHQALEDGLDAIRRREAQGAYKGTQQPDATPDTPDTPGEDGEQ